ncbi:MAG: imidazole glycerol phosphate synthase subunit HisH [Rhodospirillaceae bacterium]|nr:imidazole glycerol phosphate synthase subunit HisH [Rhodospirillaceae bacterium]|tara:strand:+ start:947 stop:1606 length:660 start_codon:yes stop_codon:yes gene_type:complete
MNLVIIDYGSGNLRSVENAFKNTVKTNELKFTIQVTNKLALISKADHLVLPGVGSFPDCKKGLLDIEGLIKLLTNEVINKRKKFLGICVGMQLMVNFSLEKRKTDGFCWLDGYFEKIKTKGLDYLGRDYKIPHMGWNNLHIENSNHPILKNISESEKFYFVHSYALQSKKINQIIASTKYSQKIPAIIGKENYIGVQFHPEKSGNSGQKFIYNWLKWRP